MQVWREKADYDLPDDFGRITSVIIDDRERMGAHMQIPMIGPEEMVRMRAQNEADTLGMPVYASVVGERLWFYPTPDDTYNVIARYEPAEKEI